MNEKKQQVKTRFGRPTRFTVRPALAEERARFATDLQQLKARLLVERFQAADAETPPVVLRQAADEAASRAWLTPYPLLVLPALFDELADTAEARLQKQEEIRQRSLILLAA